MKNIAIILALTLSTTAAFSQATRSDIAITPGKAGGVYYAYPIEQSMNTPAPKGYKPFYISHYGRHGSRYLISDKDYTSVIDRMRHAEEHNALTSKGKLVLSQLDSIYEEARGRGGELTPLGNRQHNAIANRMYKAFPEVFVDDAEITAKSTTVMRCAHSMFAFVEGLKENNPKLKIPRESGERAMNYLNYHSKESGPYSSHTGEWYQDWRKFKAEKTKPERLMNELFNDSLYVRRWVDPQDLMWGFYWIAVDMQNMETDIDMSDLFTPDELFDLWEVFNFNFYACNSSYPPALGLHVDNAKNLAQNVLDTANDYIDNGKTGATLRFGHDGNIIPFAALMQFDNSVAYEADPYKLSSVYSDFRISPMAANVQIVFFRNKDNDVICKFMLNERETHIPVKTDNFPFYKWEDAKAWLQTVIDTPSKDFMHNN